MVTRRPSVTRQWSEILLLWGSRWWLQTAFAFGFGVAVGLVSVWTGVWMAAR